MTLYDVLGIPKSASAREIKFAYRRMAKKYHPDRGGDARKFQQICAAYTILSSDTMRLIYDETGDTTIRKPADTIRQEALADLSNMFDALIDAHKTDIIYFDIIGHIRKETNNIIRTTNIDIQASKRAVRQIEKLKGRMKHKKMDANLFEMLLDQKIKGANKTAATLKHKIEVAEEILKLLDDYDFKREESKTFLRTSTIYHTTGA